MPQKINNQNEVTLEKSPSGTWVAPTKSNPQLQPWLRLWLVTGVIYLMALALCYYVLVPDRQSIERKMVFSITEEVKRYEGMAFAGESPAKIFEIASSKGYAAWIASLRSKYRIGPEGNSGFDLVEKEYREAISGLPLKRSLGVIICFIAWIIPMALLYAVGLTVNWIRKGASRLNE